MIERYEIVYLNGKPVARPDCGDPVAIVERDFNSPGSYYSWSLQFCNPEVPFSFDAKALEGIAAVVKSLPDPNKEAK